jgi:PPK2 family polyphosphate:nucleotide phosphotransferase
MRSPTQPPPAPEGEMSDQEARGQAVAAERAACRAARRRAAKTQKSPPRSKSPGAPGNFIESRAASLCVRAKPRFSSRIRSVRLSTQQGGRRIFALHAQKGRGSGMPRKEILEQIETYVQPFRIAKGKGVRLRDFDAGETLGLKMDKDEAADLLARGSDWLAMEQDMLYAQDRWSLLLVFQAMDAAGKDGAIKHVMARVNPQGCEVTSFKQPSAEELSHDFLWRYAKAVPARGRIGIFNRSYYEEALVVRVHQELLNLQNLPPEYVSARIWDERLADIAHFEDYLTRQGVIVLKFFLNLSRKEQKKRFMKRLDDPDRHWKFSPSDVRERRYWDDYMHAFEEAIRATATPRAPWYVVPADNKWFTRLVVAAAIIDVVERLDLAYPEVDAKAKQELSAARAELEAET